MASPTNAVPSTPPVSSTSMPLPGTTVPNAPPEITAAELEAESLKLTPQQVSQWQDTMSLMAWTAPGFRHLFYKLLANNNGSYGAVPTHHVPVAATDAKNILINPDTFFKYDLRQRVFIMGHEIVHNVYGDVEFLKHCGLTGTVPMSDGTVLPFRNSTMQKAMDFRINALLRDSKIGTPPPDCLLDDTIAVANDSVVDAYKKVYEDEESGGNKTGKFPGFDHVLAPGSSNGSQNQPRNQQQWGVEIAAAQVLENMKSQGKMSGALQRMFEQILNPVVPWTDHIRGIFNRKVGSGSYNWRRPDRRFIVRDLFMPSRSGNGAGWVVCWGDTSGSIGQDEMNHYIAELTSIMEDCQPQRLTVVWCDAEIKRIDEIAEPADLEQTRYEGAPGGGGTDCHPVFAWIAEHTEKPEVFIGFTDGFVDFPDQEPDYLCIWAMTSSKEAPFGDTVHINP
jgi:predicted metal-dependent peptidase